jgi:hypothetical protein
MTGETAFVSSLIRATNIADQRRRQIIRVV